MSTESSIDHPSVIDDLDAGDSEAVRTKMTFAKMQTPPELRESFMFEDKDFEMQDNNREESDETVHVEGSEDENESSMTGSGYDLFDNSQHKGDNENDEEGESFARQESDNLMELIVYNSDDNNEKSKAKKTKKPKKVKDLVTFVDENTSESVEGAARQQAASLGLY
jgi:hypothetical protein